MHEVRLVHNPTAGDTAHSKKQLLSLIESYGFSCSYSSSKKKILRAVSPATDVIAVAGGDGTIRKTVLRLLEKKLKYKRPLAILPVGTANNIASSLGIDDDHNRYISTWKDAHKVKLDVGFAGLAQNGLYFIESFGLGIFPALMKSLAKRESSADLEPEEEIKQALFSLIELIKQYPSFKCQVNYGTGELVGDFLMVEVMNIPRLGPRLTLAPNADPGDGLFNVVAVHADQRDELIAFISAVAEGKAVKFPVESIPAEKINLAWKTKDVHVDDEIISGNKRGDCEIIVLSDLIEVLTEKV